MVILVIVTVVNFLFAGVFWMKYQAFEAAPELAVDEGVVDLPVIVAGGEAPVASAGQGGAGASGRADLEAKVVELEAEVGKLRAAVANLDVTTVLEEREEIFASEEGRGKADEFYEMGQFATAGEGYLTFLRKFPEHPDAEVILKRASQAFRKAGYEDKALMVFGSMVEAFPESRGDNLAELARMELGAKRYDDAIAHATEAAELAGTVDERYWRLLYRAWYVQERDGIPAGVAAYQEVERSLASEGLGETPMFTRAVEKREELQKRLR